MRTSLIKTVNNDCPAEFALTKSYRRMYFFQEKSKL